MRGRATPRRRPDVRRETLPDGSGVLYDPQRQLSYAITASAVRVWDGCDGCQSEAAIVACLSEVHEAEPVVIARDVAALLDHLASLGLLVPAGDGDATG